MVGKVSASLLLIIIYRISYHAHLRATGNDEMCNFYIMFYTDSAVRNPAGQCGGVQSQALVDHMPADSDVTLPPNALLDEVAHGHHHHHHAMTAASPDHDQPLPPTGQSRFSLLTRSLIRISQAFPPVAVDAGGQRFKKNQLALLQAVPFSLQWGTSAFRTAEVCCFISL